MFYDISLYLSLFILTAGLLFRFCQWFRLEFGTDTLKISLLDKFTSVLTGIFKTIFSVRIFYLFYSLIFDSLFQLRILKISFLRWFIHITIFAAFVGLIFMHVFDETITRAIFPDYASTLNPFIFLRNIMGFLVLAGLLVALIRRVFNFKDILHIKNLKMASNRADYFIIALIAMIIISGFLLESAKIISEAVFDDMLEEYSDIEDNDENEALKAFWGKEFSVVFSISPDFSDTELFETGLALHEDNCASCHSKPTAAFVSYSFVMLVKPFALFLNEHRADIIFWYIHFLCSFIVLAVLPFTKAFHLISSPLSLCLNKIVRESDKSSAIIAVKRAVELDACVHCGACSDVCSVGPLFNIEKNENILPSEKIQNIREMLKNGGTFSANTSLLAGSMICTDCFRCNDVCPSGIDLRDIWNTANCELKLRGYLPPHKLVKQKTMHEWNEFFEHKRTIDTENCLLEKCNSSLQMIDDPAFFVNCVQCTICANVCPVVANLCPNADGTFHEPGVSPQQVMNLLRLGMKDMAMVSGLVWDCLSCYMCQEHCPQEIPVTDILLELRNQGFERLENLEISDEKQE